MDLGNFVKNILPRKANNGKTHRKILGKTRRKKSLLWEEAPLDATVAARIDELSKKLIKQIDKELKERKYATASAVLKLVGAGAFLTGSLAFPTLPLALKPFLADIDSKESWKRFNIPYLKRTIKRLGKQKLVETKEEKGKQVVVVTDRGRKKILKYALDELTIEKPKHWDKKWRLISYDIPERLKSYRTFFTQYIKYWGFHPLQESLFLHAYPCEEEIEFLREYLGIGDYVRIFTVEKVENDEPFRKFFGV